MLRQGKLIIECRWSKDSTAISDTSLQRNQYGVGNYQVSVYYVLGWKLFSFQYSHANCIGSLTHKKLKSSAKYLLCTLILKCM